MLTLKSTSHLTQILSVSVSFGLLTGCDPSTIAAPTPSAITLATASSADCPTGGLMVTTYKDTNKNQMLDEAEEVLSSLPMCNGTKGQDGAQGVGAGIQVTVAPMGACPAGGSVLSTFADVNNNFVLDAGETLTSTSTLCNGMNGTNGINGTNGASASITTTVATQTQCPAGGVVYSTHVGNAEAQISVVCNGTNGTNGANGTNGTNGSNGQDGADASFQMGAVGSAVKGKSYSACHHDYLYIPENKESEEKGGRGWLIFRHQKNGTADQGVGTTGFNLWNVDIADFLLVSEVKNVTYCELHWDPTLRTLTYTVVDKTDGLKGETGLIQFK